MGMLMAMSLRKLREAEQAKAEQTEPIPFADPPVEEPAEEPKEKPVRKTAATNQRRRKTAK